MQWLVREHRYFVEIADKIKIFASMKMFKILFLILFFFSCNHKSIVEENFAEFDRRFHSDSLFQMSRITFPLKGKMVDGFDKKDWSAKNWSMMKSLVTENTNGKNYKKQTHFSDTLVTEKIWIENSGFSFERHFKKVNGKWFLVYCEDRNL